MNSIFLYYIPWGFFMSVISSLLFALSCNADNFIVGISYGLKEIKIGWISNLIISLITMIGTILSMTLSKIVVNYIPTNIANIIGGIMLILLGIWTIIKPLLNNIQPIKILEKPESADKDKSLHIDSKEAVALALALSINNVGLGIGASITGLNIVLTAAFTFIFSMGLIVAGYIFGSYYLSKLFNKRTTIASGLLIIILGILEILV